jgi:hypothetical protein
MKYWKPKKQYKIHHKRKTVSEKDKLGKQVYFSGYRKNLKYHEKHPNTTGIKGQRWESFKSCILPTDILIL